MRSCVCVRVCARVCVGVVVKLVNLLVNVNFSLGAVTTCTKCPFNNPTLQDTIVLLCTVSKEKKIHDRSYGVQ